METQTKTTMRTQKEDSQLQANFNTVMAHLTQVAQERKLVISAKTADGEETVDHLEYLVAKVSHLTNTGKKKLAKRLFFASTATGMRRVNGFLSFLHRTGVINERLRLNYSSDEKAIQAARAEYITAREAAKVALAKYKEIKGDFYK